MEECATVLQNASQIMTNVKILNNFIQKIKAIDTQNKGLEPEFVCNQHEIMCSPY